MNMPSGECVSCSPVALFVALQEQWSGTTGVTSPRQIERFSINCPLRWLWYRQRFVIRLGEESTDLSTRGDASAADRGFCRPFPRPGLVASAPLLFHVYPPWMVVHSCWATVESWLLLVG
jgi:hypothetical protein